MSCDVVIHPDTLAHTAQVLLTIIDIIDIREGHGDFITIFGILFMTVSFLRYQYH